MSSGLPPDLTLLQQRMKDIIFVLADFQKLKEKERGRGEYLQQLREDMAAYFGYLPELIERFLHLFPPNECLEWLEANEAQVTFTVIDLTHTLSQRTA